MKVIKITLVLMLFCQAVFAQKPSPEEMAQKRVDRLDEKVSLTETQKTETYAIVLEGIIDIQNLKEEDSTYKEAFRTIKKDLREQIKEVLTEEQRAILKESRDQKKRTHHQENRAYYKEHVKPVVKAKRMEFETKLTVEEKQVIADARLLKPQHKKDGKKGISKQERQQMKESKAEIKLMLQPIVTAHKLELEEIMNELEPIYEEAAKHRKSLNEEISGSRKHHKKGAKSEDQEIYRFLLSK
jgi:hypothetical protein